ncbi:hypothetical protein [Anaeromicropila populeti]|uniref:Uncharacterized protein n=1 Tax=Anaeromicropila populeti TaxID=37658 RepID=A0A1I6I9T4_9FIRM|nr:hypothetical protein [Anaeromicropila populeti]SFR63517.1 hypothetical protein SAMN05661086_00594 [Anaeromicropila populeti]
MFQLMNSYSYIHYKLSSNHSPLFSHGNEISCLYSKIVDLSRQSPTYLIKVTPELFDVSIELKEAALHLHDILEVLTAEENGIPFIYLQSSMDYNKIKSLIDLFIHNYNQLSAVSSPVMNQKLQREFFCSLSHYSDALNSCGIAFEENGLLFTESSLLDERIQSGAVSTLFSGSESFGCHIKNHAYQILLNPIEYVNKKVVTYPDQSSINFPNPYLTSFYTGLLFSGYC